MHLGGLIDAYIYIYIRILFDEINKNKRNGFFFRADEKKKREWNDTPRRMPQVDHKDVSGSE